MDTRIFIEDGDEEIQILIRVLKIYFLFYTCVAHVVLIIQIYPIDLI